MDVAGVCIAIAVGEMPVYHGLSSLCCCVCFVLSTMVLIIAVLDARGEVCGCRSTIRREAGLSPIQAPIIHLLRCHFELIVPDEKFVAHL